MIRPEVTHPAARPPDVTSTENQAPLDRAPEELGPDDQWIDDFIERLNHAIDVHNKP